MSAARLIRPALRATAAGPSALLRPRFASSVARPVAAAAKSGSFFTPSVRTAAPEESAKTSLMAKSPILSETQLVRDPPPRTDVPSMHLLSNSRVPCRVEALVMGRMGP
jgi:hypothetical protein